MLKISLDNFHANVDLVKAYILASPSKPVTAINYRTADEGICSAHYFISPKDNYQNDWEAFVTLFNCQLHSEEEWTLADINQQDADHIAHRWLRPQLEKYDLTPLSAHEIQAQTQWIIESLIKLIVNRPATAPHQDNHYPELAWSNQWGIYINSELVRAPEQFQLPLQGQVTNGIGLHLDWNLVEIFYETKAEYVLFSWGTGA